MIVSLIGGECQRVSQFCRRMLLCSKIIKRNHHDFKRMGLAPKPKCCAQPGWCNYLYGDGTRRNGCKFPEAHRETENILRTILKVTYLSACLVLAYFVRKRMDPKPDTRLLRSDIAYNFSR